VEQVFKTLGTLAEQVFKALGTLIAEFLMVWAASIVIFAPLILLGELIHKLRTAIRAYRESETLPPTAVVDEAQES